MSGFEIISGLPHDVQPYDWAVRQLRIAESHQVTRGSKDLIVAVIDLGYRHHPDLDGHLWQNPNTSRDYAHGWDFLDNDASLENSAAGDSLYLRGHHTFVAGEVAAVAPQCPIMNLRVGYGNPDSWWRAIRYAVENGARVLVVPHWYLSGEREGGKSFFDRGGDVCFPIDNPQLFEAMGYAHQHDCLIVRGTIDNRGRRAADPLAAMDVVLAVGSSNRCGQPADICPDADYVCAAAPGGDRQTDDVHDWIWGCGGDNDYISMTGGCMAAGFAGGVAALVWSAMPHLTYAQLKQILQNTARQPAEHPVDNLGWNSRLGYGILDAAKAVGLPANQLRRNLTFEATKFSISIDSGRSILRGLIRNEGLFDTAKTMIIAFNANPYRPCVKTEGQMAAPLNVHQIGHTITSVRGLCSRSFDLEISGPLPQSIWLEASVLDRDMITPVTALAGFHLMSNGELTRAAECS